MSKSLLVTATFSTEILGSKFSSMKDDPFVISTPFDLERIGEEDEEEIDAESDVITGSRMAVELDDHASREEVAKNRKNLEKNRASRNEDDDESLQPFLAPATSGDIDELAYHKPRSVRNLDDRQDLGGNEDRRLMSEDLSVSSLVDRNEVKL